MEKFADLMIFRHENALRLQEFAYLCKREDRQHLSKELVLCIRFALSLQTSGQTNKC